MSENNALKNMPTHELVKQVKKFAHSVESDYPLESDALKEFLLRYDALSDITDSLLCERAVATLEQLLGSSDLNVSSVSIVIPRKTS